MELHLALKLVAETEGISVLQEKRLINILSDLQAFDAIPASKFIISCMMNEGYIKQIKELNDWGLEGIKMLNQFVQATGFNDEYSTKIWNSFAFAFGFVDEMPNQTKMPNAVQNSTGVASSDVKVFNSDWDTDTNGRMLFKQIPICGDVNKFIEKLIAKGYQLVQPYDYMTHYGILTGSFAGVNGCQIVVGATPLTGYASHVMVFFPEQSTWLNIKLEYLKYKEKLTNKYGEPKSFEYFTDPYSEGDGYEMTALSCDHCTFASYFSDYLTDGTEIGQIAIMMSQSGQIIIDYQDKKNSDMSEAEKNEIAHDDL